MKPMGSGFMESGFTHLFVIPADGGAPRQITSGDKNYGNSPIWTKDGNSLLTSTNLNDDWEYDFRNSEIYSVDLASGKATALTDRKGPDQNPAISPDGKKILYTGRDDKVQTYQLTNAYVMNLDGSGKKEIKIKLDRSISNPTWGC